MIGWCCFALFCGGLIKGTLGVGTPLLTVPMMTLVLPVHTAVPLMSVPVVAANIWQTIHASHFRSIVKRFLPTASALLAGTLIGIIILKTVDGRWLLLTVGLFVLLMTFNQASAFKLTISARYAVITGAGLGFLSGVIGGMSSMFGPLLILYLVSGHDLDKEDFVSAISFLYLCAVLPWTIGLIVTGLLPVKLLLASVLATVPVLAGLSIGQHIRKRVSEKHFQQMIILILLTSGLSMLWQAIA